MCKQARRLKNRFNHFKGGGLEAATFFTSTQKRVGSWLHNILCGHSGRVESGSRILIKRATAAKHITLQTPATENPPSHTGTALNWAPQTCPFLMNLQHRTLLFLFFHLASWFACASMARGAARRALTSFLIYMHIRTPAEQAAGWQDIVIILKTNFVPRGRRARVYKVLLLSDKQNTNIL
jgi:hypothetical protein